MDKTLQFQNTACFYTDEGNGEPLVLIHGFCEDSSVWAAFRKYFSKNYRVIVPDLPGYGNSALPEKLTIEWMADCVYALLEKEKILYPTIIGHSMGGYITMALTEKHPGFPEKIGLFHSHAYADGEEKKKNRQKSIDFVQKNGTTEFVSELVPNLFAEKFRTEHKETVARQNAHALTYPAETITAGLHAMMLRYDRTSVLKAYKKPVLFILGKEDKTIPYLKSVEQCRYPAVASVHILNGVAHMGMLEAQDKTIEIVEDFLNLKVSSN